MGALDAIVRSGKALYVGVSNYDSEQTARAAAILRDLGTPLLINQPSYSMFNRWTEADGLLDTLERGRRGLHRLQPAGPGPAHRPLPRRHPRRLPGRAPASSSTRTTLTEEKLATIRGLAGIAERRGQSLAQLALAWALRDPRMTSLIIGASSVPQLEANVAAATTTSTSPPTS